MPSQMQRGPCLIALQLERSPPLLIKKILSEPLPTGHAEVRAVGEASTVEEMLSGAANLASGEHFPSPLISKKKGTHGRHRYEMQSISKQLLP